MAAKKKIAKKTAKKKVTSKKKVTKKTAKKKKAVFNWKLITVPGVGHDNFGIAPVACKYLFGV